MKLNNAKLGDKYYGLVYKYSCRFLKSIRLVEFEVIKINPKTVGIAFDKNTRKYPQLLKKDYEDECINKNPIKLLEDYKSFLEKSNFPNYLKEKLRKYCDYKIKKLNENELAK